MFDGVLEDIKLQFKYTLISFILALICAVFIYIPMWGVYLGCALGWITSVLIIIVIDWLNNDPSQRAKAVKSSVVDRPLFTKKKEVSPWELIKIHFEVGVIIAATGFASVYFGTPPDSAAGITWGGLLPLIASIICSAMVFLKPGVVLGDSW